MSCDWGEVRTVTSLHDFPSSPSTFAVKVYRYPPSSSSPSYSDSFEVLFQRLSDQHLPLFVDSSLPEQRMLVLGSPYRHCPFDERKAGKPIDEASFNPGAYQDEGKLGHSSSESEDEDWVFMKPDRTQSSVEGFKPSERSQKPATDPIKEEDDKESHHRRGMSKELDMLPTKQPTVFPTLIEDLDSRIRYHGSSESPLSQAELMGYNKAGMYVYSAQLQPDGEIRPSKKSLSVAPVRVQSDLSPDVQPTEQPKPSGFSERLKSRRPATLVVKSSQPSDSSAKDRQYIAHLANVPDHWESAGLPKIFKALQRSPCKVHFVNMSAASAINEVRAFKERSDFELTVETCPHYLFFAMEEIESGDTRLKAFPPIRNKTNCNLLWELLKVKCIDVISSHHASLEPELKFLSTGNFKRALSGVTGLGCSLQAVWTKLRMPVVDSQAVRERYIVRLSKWLSLNPAKVIGVSSKRGSIEKGKFADLVVWKPHSSFTLREEYFRYPQLNPYIGKQLYGEIHRVYVRGSVAYENGTSYPVGKACLRPELGS